MPTFPVVTELPSNITIAEVRWGNHDGSETVYWKTLRDGQPENGWTYKTPEFALQTALRCAEVEAANAAIKEAIGEEYHFTREQYERACASLGITPAPDSDLGTYADQFFTLDPREVAAQPIVTHQMRQRRYAGILREQREQAAAVEDTTPAVDDTPANRPLVRCDNCGCVIHGAAMNASLGTACDVDCFDAMADEPGRYATQQARR